jgi:hypothetical protein
MYMYNVCVCVCVCVFVCVYFVHTVHARTTMHACTRLVCMRVKICALPAKKNNLSRCQLRAPSYMAFHRERNFMGSTSGLSSTPLESIT